MTYAEQLASVGTTPDEIRELSYSVTFDYLAMLEDEPISPPLLHIMRKLWTDGFMRGIAAKEQYDAETTDG